MNNSELEFHIKTIHTTTPLYGCDICDKSFALKWRLRKYKEGHADVNHFSSGAGGLHLRFSRLRIESLINLITH